MSSTRCATNKMRSGLTVLGVVIGITSIVGMTSLIRGFDQSLRESIRDARPGHDLRPQFGVSASAGGGTSRSCCGGRT
jgi:putative ABC transport system permease protein